MKDLIEALTILNKYGANRTHCEHDVLLIRGTRLDDVSREDHVKLESLGFHRDEVGQYGDEDYMSFRWGSC